MAVFYRLPRARGSTQIFSMTSTVRAFSSSSMSNSGNDLKSPSLLAQKPLPLRHEPRDRNVQWVFLGCPGVGKGTYASRLSNLVGVPHIATGDLVREELSSSGPLASRLAEIVNQGKLVSDEIVINLLSKHLEAGEAKGKTGFILDGFPRTITQAEILEGVTNIDLVINLKLREDALLAKCLGRRICSECGGNYNIACIDIKGENGSPGLYMAPLLPPPHCAAKLFTRSDDTEEVVKERLRIYKEMTQPVEEFYRSNGKLLEFDLPGGIPESWPKLLHALNLEHDDKQSAAA
ncbi:probable adenylate kinase 6, chloroplastic [Juglans microcarpa x Juglans regia]|uniref:probable adenylate kinase 6, chloroplastic n=1 Tax=Juglans microcarpa x Juglans regia TaxID=2249226 RepID=UPI001B7EAD91|nr:probable adenylate kinase 6, chloroplastic [Juglans microcarpa x Juglans regia]